MNLIGRLTDGAGEQSVNAELATRISQLTIKGPKPETELTGRVVPLRQFFNQSFQNPVPEL